MGFAQPLALALFALFIPIILLYLLKQRRRHVVVSTLMFWDRILRDEHQVASITRLRKLLSLLLQLLIVALIALALARPLFAKDVLGARRIVLMLDVSASMTVAEDDGTRFDTAKALARDVVRSMSLGDTLALITVGADADIAVPFADSRKTVLDTLETVEPQHVETNLAPALELLHHLPADERETHVYIVSDGAFEPVSFEPPDNVFFAYLPVGQAKDNVGITAFQLRPLPAMPRDFEILFEARNNTDEAVTAPYELRVADNLIDAGELTIDAGGSVTRTVRQFSSEGGRVELFVEYGDAFPLDNRVFAVLRDPRPIPVLLVTAGNLFLENALATDDIIVLDTIAPADYEPDDAGDWDVTIFDRWTPEVAPDTNTIFVGAWPGNAGIEKTGDIEKPLITEWDREHPINRHLYLTNISIEQSSRIKVDNAYAVLIRSFENPLVAVREQGGFQQMVVGFDTVASDLPLRVAFPIMIANAIRHMAGESEREDWVTPELGTMLTPEDVAWRLDGHEDDDHAADAWALVRPGDEPPNEDTVFEPPALFAVDRVGVYEAAFSMDESTPLFGANLNSERESTIAPSDILPITSENPVPEVSGGLRLGTEPWWLLAVMALALLTAEWFFFHRRWVE